MSKLNRLVTMDTREIVYRVQEKFRSGTERLRHYAGVGVAPADEVLDHFKSYLVQKAEPHFYFRTAGPERERRLDFIRHTFPKWIEQAVEDVDRICRHKVK